jgi:hypothetical protein
MVIGKMLNCFSRFNYGRQAHPVKRGRIGNNSAATIYSVSPPAIGGGRQIAGAFFEGVRMSYLTLAFLFIVASGATAIAIATVFDAMSGGDDE